MSTPLQLPPRQQSSFCVREYVGRLLRQRVLLYAGGVFALYVMLALLPAAQQQASFRKIASSSVEFSLNYGYWAWLVDQDQGVPHTINLPAYRQWQKTKESWKKLEKDVDRFYKGE